MVRRLFLLRQARKAGLWTLTVFVSGFAFMRSLKTIKNDWPAPWAQMFIFIAGGYAVFMAAKESTMMLSARARKATNRIAQATVFATVAYLVLLLALGVPLPGLSPTGSMRTELILVYSWLFAATIGVDAAYRTPDSSTTLIPLAMVAELVRDAIWEYSETVISMIGLFWANRASQTGLWTLLAAAGGLSLFWAPGLLHVAGRYGSGCQCSPFPCARCGEQRETRCSRSRPALGGSGTLP